MTSLIIVYLLIGALSYWPLVYGSPTLRDLDGPWYEWLAAWAVWSVCWPYRYIMDAWYWWRAKK